MLLDSHTNNHAYQIHINFLSVIFGPFYQKIRGNQIWFIQVRTVIPNATCGNKKLA